MNKEERREAEELCPYPLSSDESFRWALGYAAACEVKRAKYGLYVDMLNDQNVELEAARENVKEAWIELEAERTRSARLFECAKDWRDSTAEECDHQPEWQALSNAIAEYEASRD